MDKEKVLFYPFQPETLKLSYLRAELFEYTKNNGFYPDYIDMTQEAWDDFMKEFKFVTFHGIPIRKVET